LILYSPFSVPLRRAADGLTGDDIHAWDKRLRKIRNILPEYGTIGYVLIGISREKNMLQRPKWNFCSAIHSRSVVLERGQSRPYPGQFSVTRIRKK
jgi:hypothetical protein